MRAARRRDRRGPELHREARFPYHPHVTVAQDVAPEALDKAYEDLADFSAMFEVDAFTLFSHSGAGPVAAAPGLPARRLTGRRVATAQPARAAADRDRRG